MSNPTELLNCPFCGNKPTMVEWTASAPEIRCDPCGIVMDGLRDEVIGAWNRRAQPEGEAPQAVAMAPVAYITKRGAVYAGTGRPENGDRPLFLSSAAFVLPEMQSEDGYATERNKGYSIGWNACREKVAEINLLPPAPAAQHADSGAPAALLKLCDQLDSMKRRLLHTPGTGQHHSYLIHEDVEAYVEQARTALAAQSQGAQAAQLRIGFANNDQGVHVSVMQQHADGSATVLHAGKVPCGDSFARFTLAAKAEAPAAQQAAAPGALLEILRDVHDTLASESDSDIDHFEDDDEEREGAPVQYAARKVMEVIDMLKGGAPGTPEAPQTAGARDVLAERLRQVEVEGWTPARDDEYVDGQLASAAVAYAQAYTPYLVPSSWPWAVEWFKPADDRRNLVKAGALIVAEIERLDRAAQLDGGQGEVR